MKSKDFPIPLRFEVLGNGVEMPDLELDYDLTGQKVLKMGEFSLSATNFYPQLVTLKGKSTKFFLLQWPVFLIPSGNLEMIGQSGRVLWKSELGAEARLKWKQTAKKIGVKSPWGQILGDSPAQNPFLSVREPFRFCISRNEEQGYSRACTFLVEVRRTEKNYSLAVFPQTESAARVIAFNEAAPLQATKTVKVDQAVQFYAETSNGISYEFVSRPIKMNLSEMTLLSEPDWASVVAWGGTPLQSYQEINQGNEGYFTKLFGWQQTIGDFREFWETRLNLKNPVLYIPGTGGGMFRQRFTITKLPSEAIRPYVEKRTPESGYVNDFKVFGQKRTDVKISSTQNSADTKDNQKDFTWYFKAEKRGQLNRSYLDVQSGDQEFKAYYELFKGYPREISARLSGIISSEGKTVFVGEFAFQYWFEDLFGWTNYFLARQRWGLSTKYFQSLSELKLSSYSDTLKITTVDLKYRLLPGLWNRDETLGLILGYQKLEYSTFKATLLGGGAFWARSMPRVFDDALNLLKIFRYPKWVDVEFIYYALPGESQTRVNLGTFALNFHGKVMWTNSFFGEAGFGVKQYSFDDKVQRLNFKFASLYGTVGMGFNF